MPPKKSKTLEETYVKMDPREHILARPDTYIGTCDPFSKEVWIFDDETKMMKLRKLTWIPGLFKIFDEILVNAADNKVRDPSQHKIEVEINVEKGYVSVKNDGTGIPIQKHKEHNMLVPELIFGHLLTSSNYDDTEAKVTGGRNGYGAKLTNVYSRKFTVECACKGKKFSKTWRNNMSEADAPEIGSTDKDDYTKITFYPDFARFGLKGFDDDHVQLMRRRVLDIAGTADILSPADKSRRDPLYRPMICKLDGQKLPIESFGDYVKMYPFLGEDYKPNTHLRINDRWEVAVRLSNIGFQAISFVNSIATHKGGTHVDYIVNQILEKVTEKVAKQRKDLEVKSHMIKPHIWIFINCLARGTPITLTNGTVKPIERIHSHDEIKLLSAAAGGLVAGKVRALLNQGQQQTVKLTFADGRTITCTPDHKFRMLDGSWKEARNLPVVDSVTLYKQLKEGNYTLNRGTAIAAGLSAPQRVVDDTDRGWSLVVRMPAAEVGSSTGVLAPFTMETDAAAERTYRFARMLGFIYADGSLADANFDKTAAAFGTVRDARCFVADCEALCAGSAKYDGETTLNIGGSVRRRVHVVGVTGQLASTLHNVPGVQRGQRSMSHPSWPAFVLDPSCPRAVLCEFLAGFFGGDGNSPSIMRFQGSTFTMGPVSCTQSSCGHFVDERKRFMTELGQLLARCGVAGAHVSPHAIKYQAPNCSLCDGETAHQKVITTIPSNDQFGGKAFMDNIGIAYCDHKWHRFELAASWVRYLCRVKDQHDRVLNATFSAANRDHSQPTKLAAAIADLKRNDAVLSATYSTPDYTHLRNEKKGNNYDTTTDTYRGLDKVRFTRTDLLDAAQYMTMIGGRQLFNAGGDIVHAADRMSDHTPVLNTYLVHRSVGPLIDTFDISVAPLPNRASGCDDENDGEAPDELELRRFDEANFVANGVVVHNCQIDNPAFDSQTKESLNTPRTKFGSVCVLPDKMVTAILQSGIVDRTVLTASSKLQQELAKKVKASDRARVTGLPKLEDANDAGTKNSAACTLILTEGDSAKALAVSGLAVVGRDRFGVFPLRGKPLNVREAGKKVMNCEEIQAIIKIMGLKVGEDYKDVSKLRYGRIMIMADQDHDGSHIKGLLINFVQFFWPSLLRNVPGFIMQFITPIVKAMPASKALARTVQPKSFFSIPDFLDWKREQVSNDLKKFHIKYYKGLGTSTAAEGREYFKNIDTHRIAFFCDKTVPQEDEEAIKKAFAKDKLAERKVWVSAYCPETHVGVDFRAKKQRFRDFVDKELILFSVSDNIRSIPSVVDGLKPSQRKVLYGCFKRNLTRPIKVAQLGGYVSEHAAYHHGEASLNATIIGLAQDYPGANNIALLIPDGQFGTRHNGGKDCASARYIFTALHPITRLLFNKDDDYLLDYNDDDGFPVEPTWYVPVIPLVLINGASGIGTGFATEIPNYNPFDIIDNIRIMLNGEEPTPMTPWNYGINNQCEPRPGTTAADGKFHSKGKIVDNGGAIIRITDLPVETWTSVYKKFLEDLQEKDVVLKFRENHTDLTVDFELELHPYALESWRNAGVLYEKLQLKSNVNSTNITAFDRAGKLVKYANPEAVLKEFYAVRLIYYAKRKDYLLSELKKLVSKLENTHRFVTEVVNGTLVVARKKKAELLNELRRRGFVAFPPESKKKMAGGAAVVSDEHGEVESDRKNAAGGENDDDEDLLGRLAARNVAAWNAKGVATGQQQQQQMTLGGGAAAAAAANNNNNNAELEKSTKDYDYLLGMKLWSLTDEMLTRLADQVKRAQLELKTLEAKDAKDLWREDLDLLHEGMNKYYEERRKEVQATLANRPKTRETLPETKKPPKLDDKIKTEVDAKPKIAMEARGRAGIQAAAAVAAGDAAEGGAAVVVGEGGEGGAADVVVVVDGKRPRAKRAPRAKKAAATGEDGEDVPKKAPRAKRAAAKPGGKRRRKFKNSDDEDEALAEELDTDLGSSDDSSDDSDGSSSDASDDSGAASIESADDDDSDDDSDDVPLVKKAARAEKNKSGAVPRPKAKRGKAAAAGDGEDEDVVFSSPPPRKRASPKKAAAASAQSGSTIMLLDSDDDGAENVPLATLMSAGGAAKKSKPAPKRKSAAAAAARKSSDFDFDAEFGLNALHSQSEERRRSYDEDDEMLMLGIANSLGDASAVAAASSATALKKKAAPKRKPAKKRRVGSDDDDDDDDDESDETSSDDDDSDETTSSDDDDSDS